ncbi:MAG TPA: hypothetical protein VFV87_02425 [Pirellulaceae bacterium]|nr:hypothetical protein [Pirellulaceae bacterium]
MNDSSPAAMPPPSQIWPLVRGVGGAIAGGAAGYFVFRWLATNGFYGLMIPGLLVGLGAGLAARGRSHVLGVICAIAALMLMIVAEWLRAPMAQDPSLLYFITHLHQMDGAAVKFLMLAVRTAAAYWFGQGR